MYAPLKKKDPKKSRQKADLVSIEEGIPNAPKLCDFHVTDCLKFLNEDKKTANVTQSELTKAVDKIDLKSERNEEEKEKQDLSQDLEESLRNEINSETVIESTSLIKSSEEGSSIKESSQDLFSEQTLSTNFETSTIDTSQAVKPKTPNYNDLATEVKICIGEIKEPSAPLVKGAVTESQPLVKSPIQLQQDSHESKNKTVEVTNYNFIIKLEDYLTPYSDEKLSEFYYNSELSESKTYVKDFIHQETNNKSRSNCKLHKLLVEYMQSKNSLKANEAKVMELKEKLNDCVSAMWTVWDDVKITEKEKCSDKNTVSFVETYTHAQFNLNIFNAFTSLLTQIKQITYEDYTINSFNCSILQLRIEYYLQCILTSCPEFTNLEEDSSAMFSLFSKNSHFLHCLSELKLAISILFIFQRKQSLEIDNSFLKETRQWLSDLVSVLLRVGSWKDHIFLLNHILRCPGGVSEWATSFIQLPFSKCLEDPFSHSELNHMMTVINVLLSPIEQRENFIRKWESELASDVNPWAVIDSDGEEEEDDQSCPIKENDLVSFLNQIPFSQLFKTLLSYNENEVSSNVMSSDYMLKLFSFFTELIKILLSGLQLYNTQRYKQFTKRLCRLIYHIVQYATDALNKFKSQNVPESVLLRVQVEYDNFFLRSTKFIYSAKKHGAWQFLATIPYGSVSFNALLKLYGILQLNNDEEESVVRVDFSTFEKNFMLLPEEERVYLLTTFANMALARNIGELRFIKNVLLQLFYIGFLSSTTMEHCYKNVKSLLCSICSLHPFLMSEILLIQQNTFLSNSNIDQKLSIYLWMKLPVDVWQPEKENLDTLSIWLLEPVQSVRNDIAKIIIQSLNYGMIQGKFVIPLENHRLIALMVLKSNIKLCFDNDAGVIKNVSNLMRSQTPEQSMIDWSWNILLKLRLHLLDNSEAEICKCLSNLEVYLRNISDVESDAELHQWVLKKHPMACFVALMTTTLGHSVPIIFNKGFDLIEVLLNAGKYEAGIACLEYITLMFVGCGDPLHKCEKFISLLCRLIAADNSYVQYAKNLISNNFPGLVLRCIECMLQNQLNSCRAYNSRKFCSLIQLWVISLTRIPLWSQEPGVLYLIDKLLENSFFETVSSKVVSKILEDLLEAQSPSSETKSSLSSLVSWMNTKYTPPSLLPKGFSGEVPWFSYRIIQLEYEVFEKKTSVWVELLKEMFSSSDKKPNIDSSLKKVCNHLRIPVRSSGVLAIYKWSYQILETNITHPLVPLIWQKFFSLYFHRVPGLNDRGSVGMKFFDGILNQSLLKRVKQRLEETCTHFKTLHEQSETDIERDYFLRCYKLFQSFCFWLDDPLLHEPCLNIHTLPVQYNPELLGLIIHGSETPWIEFLEYQNIEKNFRLMTSTWNRLKNRSVKEQMKNLILKKEKSSVDEMKQRLNSYEIPIPPPQIKTKNYRFPRISLDSLMSSDKMILFIKPCLKMLLNYVQQYTAQVNDIVSLGCDMQELLPHLYVTKETRKVLKKHCSGINKTINGKNVHHSCSGPAVVTLSFEESKLNDQIKQHFGHCEKEFDINLHKALALLPSDLIYSAVVIEIAIEELIMEYQLTISREPGGRIVNDLKGTGVHLFYELVRTWCTNVTQIPPLEKAFDKYIDDLGKSFIVDNVEENDRILHLILDDDMFGEKTCKYFTPNTCATNDFIEYYLKAFQCDVEKRYVILLKFDIVQWLTEKKPKFSERSRMISAIGQGLKAVNGLPDGKSTLELLNQHMQVLLMYDFPEHYGVVLNFLLEASESQSISSSCWYNFLNALARGHYTLATEKPDQDIFQPGQSLKKLKCCFSKFATDQNLIPFDVIKGTMTLLASTFKTERYKTGVCGLYRKYQMYIEPIFIFFGMLSYSCVAKILEIDTGSLSDKIAQQLWPLINDLYAPWLVPYWVDNDKAHPVQWSQEHNSDLCVYLPWTMNDSCTASLCASIFSESIRFVFDALPGLNHVLSYAWFFYVTNFAHIYVKDYILNVVHDSLLTLPWETFVPSLQDVELMLKVVDQFLPMSHSFLGRIFVNINWTNLVQYYISVCSEETTAKLHICLLHLLVKLPLEPSLKQNEKVLNLLAEAKDYAWHLVDSCSYELVLNWFIMSCDPRIILMDERLEYYNLDSRIFSLLQSCAGYVPSAKLFHSTTLSKRLIFVRACVKWLVTSNRRFKCKSSPLFKSALCTLSSDMEIIIAETVPPQQRADEAKVLISEFLMIFQEPDLCSDVKNILCDWLSTKRSHFMIIGLFGSVGTTIENPTVYGHIIEASLENYFNFYENGNWSEVTNSLVLLSKPNLDAHEKTLADNNNFLALYSILLKKFNKKESGLNPKTVLTDLLHLLPKIKLSSDLEPKLILLVTFGFKVLENEIKLNTKEGVSYLLKFCDVLNNFVNDEGNGFLTVIGLKKSSSSNRFKLLCLVACASTTIFIKTNYPEYREYVDERILQALETVGNNKVYQNIQQYASYAKSTVKEISTVEQIIIFLTQMGLKLFNKPYFK